jgi:hypothetical protein
MSDEPRQPTEIEAVQPDTLVGWSVPQRRPPHLVQRLTRTTAPYERRGLMQTFGRG